VQHINQEYSPIILFTLTSTLSVENQIIKDFMAGIKVILGLKEEII